MHRQTTKISAKVTLFALALMLLAPALPAAAVSGTTSTSQTLPVYDLQIGTTGTGNGQFMGIWGVAGDSQGTIYVSDYDYTTDIARIQKFDKYGTYIGQVGSVGTGPGQYGEVRNIAVGPDDNLYVLNVQMLFSNIQRFDTDGTFLQSWTLNGVDLSSDTTAITVDSTGMVYVVSHSSIYSFSNTSGSPVTPVQTYPNALDSNTAGSLGCTSAGVCYTAIQGGFTSVSIDGISGSPVSSWPLSYDPDSAGVDSTHVYVGDFTNNTVHVYNLSGTELGAIGSVGTGNGQFGNDTYGHPAFNQISTGPGAVYVVDGGNYRIQRFVYADNLGTVASAPAGLATVTLPEGTDITSIDVSAVSGADKDYPLGVATLNYTDVTGGTGQTRQVEYFFETSLVPSGVTTYLYNATTHTSTAILGATITQTTQGGKTGLKVVYAVTDGGTNDMDGVANGRVGNVLGLATTAGSTPTLANTGTKTAFFMVIACVFIVAGSYMLTRRNRLYAHHSQ